MNDRRSDKKVSVDGDDRENLEKLFSPGSPGGGVMFDFFELASNTRHKFTTEDIQKSDLSGADVLV